MISERPMRRVGRSVEWHERIGSTNDRARELLASPEGDGAVVVADEQLAGRGRRGRTWLSPPGVSLMASVALRPRIEAADAWQLGLAAAVAAARASSAHADVAIRWPNDLVAEDGRKLGGLLVETMAEGDRLVGAVIGAGINVTWRRALMPADIRDTATSLLELSGVEIDRAVLLDELLDALSSEIEMVEAGAWSLDRYRALCSTLGTEVRVATGDGEVVGRAVDLDPNGAIVVEAADGRHVLTSGEVVQLR